MATFPGILTTEKGREIHGCHNKYDYFAAHNESASKPAYFFGSSNPSECAKLKNFACFISLVNFLASRLFSNAVAVLHPLFGGLTIYPQTLCCPSSVCLPQGQMAQLVCGGVVACVGPQMLRSGHLGVV